MYLFDGLYERPFLLHKANYEPVDTYTPTDGYLRLVRLHPGPEWSITRSGGWYHACPQHHTRSAQGWKLHVSGRGVDANRILEAVAAICSSHSVEFKFAVDPLIWRLMVSKDWPRPQVGKTITIYPPTQELAIRVGNRLAAELHGLKGPYVLTDRLWPGSTCVYYRWGGHTPVGRLTPSGTKTLIVRAQSGEVLDDERLPGWRLPDGIDDLFPEPDEGDDEPDMTLDHGRYRVHEALHFSATGGVYLADDLDTGRTVVLKEARPGVADDMYGRDAQDYLRKERRILTALAGVGCSPTPLSYFRDWEHDFLVEEYFAGATLMQYIIGFNPLMHIDPPASACQVYGDQLLRILVNIARAVNECHCRKIIIGDLSINNVLVGDVDLGQTSLIDFEAAWCPESEDKTMISTPGFTGPERRDAPTYASDVFAFGRVVLNSLFPVLGYAELDDQGAYRVVRRYAHSLPYAHALLDLSSECCAEDPRARPSISSVLKRIQEIGSSSRGAASSQITNPVPPATRDISVEGIKAGVLASMTPLRVDRLFAAAPSVFITNPVSIAYGASGIAYALRRLGAGLELETIWAWILSRPLSRDDIPPGLFSGLAGLAWALDDYGDAELAGKYLTEAVEHPLAGAACNVFDGSAGIGLACLRFGSRTGGGDDWLKRADQIACRLVSEEAAWSDENGELSLGYAFGLAGTCLFLLYASLALNDSRYLDEGLAHVRDLIRKLQESEEGHLTVPRGPIASPDGRVSHYWQDGSAGVVQVLLRYAQCADWPELHVALDRLIVDCCRHATLMPGWALGLSGIGNVLLDVIQAGYDSPRMAQVVSSIADSVKNFGIMTDAGTHFPGEQLLRMSCDLTTGSAGIALFLQRVAQPNLQNFDLLCDSWLPGGTLEYRP